MKIRELQLEPHWRLFRHVQITISHNWFVDVPLQKLFILLKYIESIKTSFMENVSTGVLENIKNNI